MHNFNGFHRFTFIIQQHYGRLLSREQCIFFANGSKNIESEIFFGETNLERQTMLSGRRVRHGSKTWVVSVSMPNSDVHALPLQTLKCTHTLWCIAHAVRRLCGRPIGRCSSSVCPDAYGAGARSVRDDVNVSWKVACMVDMAFFFYQLASCTALLASCACRQHLTIPVCYPHTNKSAKCSLHCTILLTASISKLSYRFV